MNFPFNWPNGFRGDVWKWKCWRTDRVTGILLAHPWAFGSGELKSMRQGYCHALDSFRTGHKFIHSVINSRNRTSLCRRSHLDLLDLSGSQTCNNAQSSLIQRETTQFTSLVNRYNYYMYVCNFVLFDLRFNVPLNSYGNVRWSVHLTTLCSWASLTKRLTST